MRNKASSPLLTVKQLRSWIATEQGYVRAVDGVDFTIKPGETYALLGESGCGKSLTALSLIQLLPQGGYCGAMSEVVFDGVNLLALSEVQMREIRGLKIGMIFQEPMSAINPVLTIGNQLEEIVSRTGVSRKQMRAQSLALLEMVGIPDPKQRYHDYAHQLSGGMKQRVMIAIALACNPDLLIADEPTTALDVTIQAQILQLLKSIQRERGMAILLITHDLGVVWQMADRLGVMYAGHLVEEAAVKPFFADPKHPYSQQLFAAIPDPEKRQHSLSVIQGQVPTLLSEFTLCRFKDRCPKSIKVCEQQLPKWFHPHQDQHVRCHLYAGELIKRASIEQQLQEPWQAPTTSHSTQPILSVEHLKVHFPIRKGLFKRIKGYVKAVDDISFALKPGKTLALVGESGCGKTTTGKALVQLLADVAGEIHLAGKPIAQQKNTHQMIQIIFQDPFASLDPRMSVQQILAEGLQAQNKLPPKDEQAVFFDRLLTDVGLSVDVKHRYPHEFSGGQRQRIAIARALALTPSILVCDEPTSALDVSVQAQILNVLKALQIEDQLAYLFITHNLSVVAYIADEIAVMYLGRIVEQGTTQDVLENPQHPYTQALLASIPKINQIVPDEQIKLVRGEQPSPITPPQGCHFHPRCPFAMEQCKVRYPGQTQTNKTHKVHCFLQGDS